MGRSLKKPSPAVSQGLNGTDATGCRTVRCRRSLAGMTSSCNMTKRSQVIYTSRILGLSHLRNTAQYAGRTPQLFSRMAATCNVIPPQEVTRQYAYNVTLRCVRGTTVVGEK